MRNGKYLERDFVPIKIEGNYEGHLWMYRNVTERIHNQFKILEREERNRLIMKSAIDAIVISNENGDLIFWNPAAEQIFGWKSEEVIGSNMADLIIPHSMRDQHAAGMKRYLSTRNSRILNKNLELPARHKDGFEFPVEIYIIKFEQDDQTYFCAFIRDISERKKTESILKLQEEKYRNIIANMNLGYLEADNMDVVLFANQSFCKMSGFSFDELRGRRIGDILPLAV